MIIYLAMSMFSCVDDKCGEDINLGKLDLTESSKAFVPYSGEETLTFEDNTGKRHLLTSKEGRQVFDSRLIINTLCRGDVSKLTFDDQEEFFEVQYEQVAFFDQSGNQVFYIDMKPGFEEAEPLESLVIYDQLSVRLSMIEGYLMRDLNIITAERQNQVSASWKETLLNGSAFVGDTVLYGRKCKEVYESSTTEGSSIFYNRFSGVVALKFDDSRYWVLVDEE